MRSILPAKPQSVNFPTTTNTKSRSRRKKVASVAHGTRFGSWRYDARAKTLDFVPLDGRLGSTVKNPAWWIHLKDAKRKRIEKGYAPEKTYMTPEDNANYAALLSALWRTRG